MEFIVLLVPIVATGVMFGVKKLAGLYSVGNGSKYHVPLRMILIVLSLLGTVATGTLNGTEIDVDSISSMVLAFMQTGVSAYLSHTFYRAVTESSRNQLS
jgi:hypothetical protein